MTSQKIEPPLDPPDHLSETSQEIWNRTNHKIDTPGRAILLQTALESYDRALQAREQIKKDGLTWESKTSGAIHLHPLLKVEKESISLAVRIFTRLGFHHFSPILTSYL